MRELTFSNQSIDTLCEMKPLSAHLQSVYQVVLQRSITAQTRQLIVDISNDEE